MIALPTYTLLYDGACRICTAQAHGLARYDTDRRIALLDITDALAFERYSQISLEDAQRWLHIVGPDKRIWCGADAMRQVLLLLPLGRPLGALMYLPGVMPAARRFYNWFARNRYRFSLYYLDPCASGACAIHMGLGTKRIIK